MKKNLMLLALGASLVAVPAIAMPGGPKGDANAEWTRAQAQTQANEVFAKMDMNRDGKLDASDRAAQRSQRQEARFAALDANKDGSVSKAEWDKHGADRLAKSQQRRAERTERVATGGADSEKPQMRRHFGRKGGGHHGMMRGGMRGDQSMTQAEFVAKSLDRFDKLDTNKDGKVTREERTAARAAMREHRGHQRSGAVAPTPPAE